MTLGNESLVSLICRDRAIVPQECLNAAFLSAVLFVCVGLYMSKRKAPSVI